MRKVALLFLLVPTLAHAVEYEIEVDIADEDDLYELYSSEQISEQTFDALLDLLQRKVDLNRADVDELYELPGLTAADAQAIVAYRSAAGSIPSPESLVAAGIIGADKLRRIEPFVIASAAESGLTLSGEVRAIAQWTSEDDRFPASVIEARLRGLSDLTLGVDFMVTRNHVANVRFDSSRNALTAEPLATRPEIAKIYADWRTRDMELIAGNYRVGFGLGVTFDNTPHQSPHGVTIDEVLYRNNDLRRSCSESTGELATSPCPTDEIVYITPDFKYREGLFGIAGHLRHLDLGAGWLSVAAWAARSVHGLYQYQTYDAALCADPANDADPRCAAPKVYRTQDDPTAPTSTFSYQTLPDMFAEPLGGGNVSYFFDRRSHIGITGWGAKPEWLVEGIALDFQEWAKYPRGGAYGAVGADAGWGTGNLDLAAEITRSIDSSPTGGGFGGIIRGILTWPKNELELSLRYYDEKFANPYAGSIAEPDSLDGQRARDEVGVRLRFGGRVAPRIQLRSFADFWVLPSTGTPRLRVEARGDYLFASHWSAGLYLRYQDRDLRDFNHGTCYSGSADSTAVDAIDELPGCTGSKLDAGVVLMAAPVSHLLLRAQFQTRFVDSLDYPNSYATQLSFWASVGYQIMPSLTFYARTKYLNEDPSLVGDDVLLEESLWTYASLNYRALHGLWLRLRYDNRIFLDERKSIATRVPNPEHWLRLDIESKF